MSISPIDNKLLPLGPTTGPLDAHDSAPVQPDALETTQTETGAPLQPSDAQSLLAQDVWPQGSRLFNLAASTSEAAAEPPNGDELERIATQVTSYLS